MENPETLAPGAGAAARTDRNVADLIRFAERFFLIVLAAGVIIRITPAIPQHPQLALFLISELVGVFLLLTQRRGEWTTGLWPIAIALLGTGVGLMVSPVGLTLVHEAVSTTLMVAGALISLAAKLFLGRSFGLIPANRGVKSSGVYRLVRHPMYLGYMVNQLGFLLMYFSPWNVAIYVVAWTAFWLRATEEEKFLRTDPEYRAYAEKVRYRLVPGIA